MEDQNSAPMDKNDLMLLMEAYENTIKFNTTLLEQQRKLLKTTEFILTYLNKSLESSTDLKIKINELSLEILNTKNINIDIKSSLNLLSEKFNKIKNSSSMEHLAMKIQLYFALFGIASLFGIIVYSIIKYNQ